MRVALESYASVALMFDFIIGPHMDIRFTFGTWREEQVMYCETKQVDGQWYFRTKPDGEWIKGLLH